LAASKPVPRLLPKKHLPLLLSLLVSGHWVVLPASGHAQQACSGETDCDTTIAADETTVSTEPSEAKPSRKQRRAARKQAEQQRDHELNQSLDWYPMEALTPEQQSVTPVYCDGAYIEPNNQNPEAGQELERSPLRASADSSELRRNEQATLEGNVDLAKGDLVLRADQAAYDKNADRLNAEGNIELREKGVLVRGDAATINVETGTGSLDNAQYVLHQAHARGAADKVKRESETIVRMDNGSYTHCSPADKAWLLRASDIKLDQESGVGSAKHARLRVADVPVFYFPYMTFPIDNRRRSGLLFPSFGTAKSSGGLDFSVPFYWNIAPNWDATIAARYIEARGTAAELEVRHMNRFSNWVVAGSYIDDEEYQDDRWFYAINENGILPGGWFHGINYTEVSDKDYLTDLSGATSLEIKRSTNLEQSAAISKFGQIYTFTAQAVQYQVIDDFVQPQYRRLPQLSLALATDKTAFRPTWLLVAQGTQFDIDNTSKAIGGRVYLEPGVSFPMLNSWGYVTPTVKIKSVSYALGGDHDLRPGVPVENENPSTTVPMASVDAGMYFDRATSWFGQGFTNTLEPRIYYLYNKFEDQTDQPLFDTGFTTFDYNQLFRESRFTGYDRIPDANQVSLGLTTRLIQDSSGTETIWASIGQIFYLDDRKVSLDQVADGTETESSSQVAGELGYQWTRHLRSYVSALYDHELNQTDQAGGRFRYAGQRGMVLNFGHNYRRQDSITFAGELIDNTIRQSDFSGIVPVNRHWALMARYNYDHTNTRILGEVFGIEYNSCCWKARVAYQSGLNSAFETERGIYFQIEMKGLGGTDTGVNSILENSIVGFEDYENRDHF
jgi:LPS-assembly protein